jgi:DNA-binding NtrC family response regulator
MPTSPPDSATVLLVDDEPRLRRLLGQSIEQLGFGCDAVGSAERAWRRLHEAPPTLAILDLNLPEMDGMTLLEQIHAEQPDLPVIILTAFGDLPTAQQAIHLDVVDFLTKPYQLRDLEQALDRAFKRSQIQSSASACKTDRSQAFDRPVEPSPLAEVERQHVLATLEYYQGDRPRTAEALDISLRTLYYRLERYRDQGVDV